jgi:hypothetical protein
MSEVTVLQTQPMQTQALVLTPTDMIARAVESGANIEVLTKLMDLQDRYEKNTSRKAFDAAIAQAKSEIPVIGKNRTVDFTGKTGVRTHYKHEDLAEIARIVGPILAKHGLSYRFRTANEGGMAICTCIVSHRDGHAEENTLSAAKDESGNKNHIQAIGSTLTYLQRMTLKAALGLAASDDDDGKAAGSGATVTDEQADAIRDQLQAVGGDIGRFLQQFRVECIPDIAAADYQRAMNLLDAKARQKAKANG